MFLCCVVLFFVLRYDMLFGVVLCCVVSCGMELYCVVLCSVVLWWFAFCCLVLSCCVVI